ncbi:riboflavin synthase [Pediococcus pentosaceus]|uniref:riboflavin synthase n=1 Tax=Pediococcus pentosaceus TaxID=1255 RepID=UPI00132FED1C|nr:riboflavin synthase [Pediococcus pentosaceus]KAF0468001.1 riboflavin synthase [Pediococcus pentosaceus]MBF7102029.1 riboflavin synthase [Pediococcus pentosaceus]MCM6809440.1 riboflavin synthase [Pediococcus pentosaceus]MCM6812199.1 riboflavin synthase [Pediococcus pentosaceus]MCM6818698.1 riboflavin synthase [Pediococcus pentosaceus]
MFTGIIKAKGIISQIKRNQATAQIMIATPMTHQIHSKIGDSIAINGICLTITSILNEGFTVEVMPETTNRTSLANMKDGMEVNPEPALLATDRLDGHFVLGHVDTTAKLVNRVLDENSIVLTFEINPDYIDYVVEKGSITIDGVSLTVSAVEKQLFEVSLIPHTLQATTLDNLKANDVVNVETDILGKYILNENRGVNNEE